MPRPETSEELEIIEAWEKAYDELLVAHEALSRSNFHKSHKDSCAVCSALHAQYVSALKTYNELSAKLV
jgi:hypothetical protein